MSDTITEDMPRTERDMEEELLNLIADSESDIFADVRADAFADTGLLTNNKGVQIRFPNGSVYQVTIVQSERPDPIERKCLVRGCDEPCEDDWTACEVHYELGDEIDD